jgi:hypothetical protein
MGGETSLSETTRSPAKVEFIAHFGGFNGQRERQRWETLVESIGLERAREIASWAERKEIHLLNRGGLMDSLETAARKWTVPPGGKGPAAAKSNAEVIREVAGRKNGQG